MDSLVGITHDKWLQLLGEKNNSIAAKNWPKSATIFFKSLFISHVSKLEAKEFGEIIANEEIQHPLIFILGHWRSGTSLLQNYLALDPQFATPLLNDILYPGNFLRMYQRGRDKELGIHNKRPMDNIHVESDSPAEDEFALASISLKSQLFSWVFPRNKDFYDKYLTFEHVSESEIAEWKSDFRNYLKKLSLKYKRPLVLKSPQHTARVALLLEMFPDAKFIHIHRHPFAVYQSTEKLYKTAVSRFALQKPLTALQRKKYIFDAYSKMYTAYFNQIKLIPENNFIDIAFEELEKDAVSAIRNIYRYLDIRFDEFRPILQQKASENKNYKKNNYSKLSEQEKQEIYAGWQIGFRAWNYDQDINNN